METVVLRAHKSLLKGYKFINLNLAIMIVGIKFYQAGEIAKIKKSIIVK